MIGQTLDTYCSQRVAHTSVYLRIPRAQAWPERPRGLLQLQAMTRRGSKNSEAVLIRSHQQRQPSRFALGYWPLLPPTTSCTARGPLLAYSEKPISIFWIYRGACKVPFRGSGQRGKE